MASVISGGYDRLFISSFTADAPLQKHLHINLRVSAFHLRGINVLVIAIVEAWMILLVGLYTFRWNPPHMAINEWMDESDYFNYSNVVDVSVILLEMTSGSH